MNLFLYFVVVACSWFIVLILTESLLYYKILGIDPRSSDPLGKLKHMAPKKRIGVFFGRTIMTVVTVLAVLTPLVYEYPSIYFDKVVTFEDDGSINDHPLGTFEWLFSDRKIAYTIPREIVSLHAFNTKHRSKSGHYGTVNLHLSGRVQDLELYFAVHSRRDIAKTITTPTNRPLYNRLEELLWEFYFTQFPEHNASEERFPEAMCASLIEFADRKLEKMGSSSYNCFASFKRNPDIY